MKNKSEGARSEVRLRVLIYAGTAGTMKAKKTQTKPSSKPGPSKPVAEKQTPKRRKPPAAETHPRYEIPRSKIERALEFLEADDTKVHRSRGKLRGKWNPACFGNIASMVSAGRGRVDNYMYDTANALDVARHCALRGRWPELMQTVAILMEDIRRYDVHGVMRNALYCILADPALNDPSFLEGYLYSNPRCTNPGDVSYCIDKILEVFQGVTIVPSVRRNAAGHNVDQNDAESTAVDDRESDDSSEDE